MCGVRSVSAALGWKLAALTKGTLQHHGVRRSQWKLNPFLWHLLCLLESAGQAAQDSLCFRPFLGTAFHINTTVICKCQQRLTVSTYAPMPLSGRVTISEEMFLSFPSQAVTALLT